MSFFKLFQVDIVQTSQLYLGGGVNQPLPSSGLVLYSDGQGGTYWSTTSGGAFLSQSFTSTVDGLGTASYISSSQFLSTIEGLGNVFISTGTPGYGDVTFSQLISTTIGLGNIYVSTGGNIGQVLSTNLFSTVDGLGNFYISSGGLASTVDGLSQAGYISTLSLQSTIDGLGLIYPSSPDIIVSRQIAVGLSTAFVSTTTFYAQNSFQSNIVANDIYTAQITASTSVNILDAPIVMTYSTTPPVYPLRMTAQATNPLQIRMESGGSNVLWMGVDGGGNATITSENPAVQTNPLLITASEIQTTISTLVIKPDLLVTPNNTQIIGSTISTSIIQGNSLLFSSILADGSGLYNLNAISTQTLLSTAIGYDMELNVVSTQTLASTVQGLPLYLGYLSTATLGPILSTALVTASSLQLTTQLQAASLLLSTNASSASNFWLATGTAATPAATIQTSVDGISWSNITSGGFSVSGNGIAWNGELWVAVGEDGTNTNNIQYSTDGLNFIAASGATFSVAGNGVAWNGRIWVAVGDDTTQENTIKYSLDGINWSNSSGSGFAGEGYAVAWNGRLWVAVGTDTIANNAVKYSLDGVTWSNSLGSGFSGTQYTVAWNGSYWLIGGTTSATSNSISISRDGISWASVNAPFQSAVNGLTWNGVYWVASATDNTVTDTRYSFDGYTWVLGSGTKFTNGSLAAAWNGRRWVQVGRDPAQVAEVKYSDDGINWQDSATNNFTQPNAVAFSSNVIPFYQQDNFQILPQAIPLFLTSANTLFFTPRATEINNTLYIDGITNALGINCNAPSFALDVYGSINASSLVIASSFVGDGSQLRNLPFVSSATLQSTIIGLGSLGYISTADFSSLALSSLNLNNYVSTSTLNQSLASTTTGLLNRITFTSSVFISTSFSTITAQSLVVSSISTNFIIASTGLFSTVNISTSIEANTQIQSLLVSSLRFFDGDGFINFADIQASNLSTVGLFASSLLTNSVRTSNIFLGSNYLFSPIQFFGMRGAYNNTIIAETSTATTSQELLFFKGSSVSDQFRFQTTGSFRVETGVPARLFPNTAQTILPSFLIDSLGNMQVNGTTLYADAPNNRVGVACNAPGVTLDVNGTLRTISAIISSGTASSFTIFNAFISTLVLSSINFVNTSTIQAVNINTGFLNVSTATGTSSIFSTVFISSILNVSTLVGTQAILNLGDISTLSVNNLSTGRSLFGTIGASTLQASTVTMADVTTERLLVSSLRFYDGDGFITFADIQASNFSTIGIFTSSIQANAVRSSNIFAGSNYLFSPIQFFGLRGAFNNTIIAEQSTSISTQELLFFRGSSIQDQFRFQTTGAFRIETGVPGRLFPNTAQTSTPSFILDALGNLAINSTSLFVDAVNTRIGIGCNVPGTSLDINGTLRTISANISSGTASSFTIFNAFISTLVLSSVNFVNASTIQSRTIDTAFLNVSTAAGTSSIFSTAFISSILNVSTLIGTQAFINLGDISTLSVNTLSTGRSLFGTIGASTLQGSTVTMADVTAERLLMSSFRFYEGDGFVVMADLQTSNLSSIAIYGSTIIVNHVQTRFGVSTQQLFTSSITGRTISLNNSTPLFTLEVNGNARISSLTIDAGAGVTSTNTTFSLAVWGAGGAARVGATTWTQISDQRIKENIVEADYTRCYEDIKAIPLRRFTYCSTLFNAVPLKDKNVLGFIAQEVSTIQPKSITVSEAFGIQDLNWLNIDQMNMALYGAVKKLIQDNEAITSTFMNMNDFYLSKISSLEGKILGNNA